MNLWGDERKKFSPGCEHRVLHTPEFGPVGLLISWNLAFPKVFQCLTKQGARMVIIHTLRRRYGFVQQGFTYDKDSEETFINSVFVA